MSKEDAPNFKEKTEDSCEDCKHIYWDLVLNNRTDTYTQVPTCRKYDFIIKESPLCLYKCDSWEGE